MKNDAICNLIGIIGAVVGFFSMGFIFFGVLGAWVPAIIGMGLCAFSLMNYD